VKILVTAGNTQVPIDRVRCITNIFTGRTGSWIALAAYRRDHAVTLLTSHPSAVDLASVPAGPRWAVHTYRTFDELRAEMGSAIKSGEFDAVIHSAAVSDYLLDGVYAPGTGTSFDPSAGNWSGSPVAALVDRSAGKIKSEEPELWLRLVRAPKLIDCIRPDWHFSGTLVKFKLEVGASEEELRKIAETSRKDADLMVANTLEGAHEWAMIGPIHGKYERVWRDDLPDRLLEIVEQKLAGNLQ